MKRLFVLYLLYVVTIFSQSDLASLQSDEIRFSENSRFLIASSNVILKLSDIEIHSENLILDVDLQKAYATGNIEITRGDETFYSDTLSIDLEKEEVELTDITITIEPPEKKGYVYIKTKKLIDNKSIKKGFSGLVTTCDYENPHHYLWTQYYRYTPDKHILMFNVFIYNKLMFMPIGLWLPVYYYSLGEKKVVWNFPTIGKRDKEGWGWFVQNQIDYKYKNNKDSSLLVDYYEKKGFGYGINHHYDFADSHSGSLYLYNFDFEDSSDSTDPNKKNTIIKLNHEIAANDATTIKTSYIKSDVDEKINSSGSDKREEKSFEINYDELGNKFNMSMYEKDNQRQESKSQKLTLKRSFNGFTSYNLSLDKSLNYTKATDKQTYTGAYNHKFTKDLILYNNFKLRRNDTWTDSVSFDEQISNTHSLKYTFNKHINFEVNIDTMKDLDEGEVTDDINQGLINNYFYKLPEIKVTNKNRKFLGFSSNQNFTLARYQEARYDSSTEKRRIFPSNADFTAAPNTFYMKQSLKRTFNDLKLKGKFEIGSSYEQYTFFLTDKDAFSGDAAYKIMFTSSYSSTISNFIKTTTKYNSAYSPDENNSPFYAFDSKLQSESNSITQKITFYYKSEKNYKWDHSAGYNYIKDEWNDYKTKIALNPTKNYSFTLTTGVKIDPERNSSDYDNRWDNLTLKNELKKLGNHINIIHYISIDLNKYFDEEYTYIQNSYTDFGFHLGKDPEYKWKIGFKQSYNTKNQDENSKFQTRKYELKSLYVTKREHKRDLEVRYTKSTDQWDIIYTVLAFPDDPIEIKKKKDLWTIEGRLKENTKERFE
jgi:hypothetical protein